jgi:hypothetical protein
MMPRVILKVDAPKLYTILERNRKQLLIGEWSPHKDQLQTRELLRLGDGTNGTIDGDALGFDEFYFQYVIMVEPSIYYVWPLEQEALLSVGWRLEFDSEFKLKYTRPLLELAEQTIRPTAVLWESPKEGKQIMMVGGQMEKKFCQNLNIRTGVWSSAPKLPDQHNTCLIVAVNWKNKAIFTFTSDAAQTIKCAFLDLEKMSLCEQAEGENHPEHMEYALISEMSEHDINYLDFKCGVAMRDGRILCLARGRPKECSNLLQGLVLFFQPMQDEHGRFSIRL